MTPEFSTIALTTTLFLSTCATTPTFTKRYESVVAPAEGSETIALDISAFRVPVASSSKKRLVADLPEKAQAEALEAISREKSASTEAIVATLSSEIGKKKPSSLPNLLNYSRRIAVTTDMVSPVRESDRLSKLTTTFLLSGQPGVKFSSWSQLSSPYVQVDLGDLTFNQSNSFGAEAGFDTLSPDLQSLGLTAEMSKALTETIRLRETVLPLYGILNQNKARLVQQGSLGRDLVGIQTIDLIVELDKGPGRYVVTGFTPNDTKNNKPAKLSTSIIYPPNSCSPITLSASSSGILRKVVSGDDTISESDDVINLIQAATASASSFEVVSQEDIRRPKWEVQANGQVLQYWSPGMQTGTWRNLEFIKFSDVEAILKWGLTASKLNELDGLVKLSANGQPITKSFFQNAKVATKSLVPGCP